MNALKIRHGTPSNIVIGVAVLAVMVLSFALRSHEMGNRDLHLDEVVTYDLVTSNTLLQILSPYSEAMKQEVHPPVFFAVTYLWVHTLMPVIESITGNREYAFRIFHAAIGSLTALLMYVLGQRARGAGFGVALSLCYSLCAYSIQIAHRTRMYPMMELVAVFLLIESMSLCREFRVGSLIRLSIGTTLLMLIQYLSIFYIIGLWSVVLFCRRDRFGPILFAGVMSAVMWSWWLPGLITQLQREADTSIPQSSSGAIIPYTLFQFITGDTALPLSRHIVLGPHLLSIAVFAVLAMYSSWVCLKNRIVPRPLGYGIAILGISLGLHWLATFMIQRVFNSTFYAICILPATLFVLCGIIREGMNRGRTAALIVAALLFGVNAFYTYRFFRNELVAFEPWRVVCQSFREKGGAPVFVFPQHMRYMTDFYKCPDGTRGIPLAWRPDSVREIRAVVRETGGASLIISHDRGQRVPFIEAILQGTGFETSETSYPGIDVVAIRDGG